MPIQVERWQDFHVVAGDRIQVVYGFDADESVDIREMRRVLNFRFGIDVEEIQRIGHVLSVTIVVTRNGRLGTMLGQFLTVSRDLLEVKNVFDLGQVAPIVARARQVWQDIGESFDRATVHAAQAVEAVRLPEFAKLTTLAIALLVGGFIYFRILGGTQKK